MSEKITIKANDKYVEKTAAVGDLMKKVSFTKMCGVVLLFSSILIYGASIISSGAAFVCCAIFMLFAVFIIFKSETDMNYYQSTYGVEKPQLLKTKFNMGNK